MDRALFFAGLITLNNGTCWLRWWNRIDIVRQCLGECADQCLPTRERKAHQGHLDHAVTDRIVILAWQQSTQKLQFHKDIL